MKNTKQALRDISLKLTREMRFILLERDHINTGLLIQNLTIEAAYNPLASKTGFTVIYNAPYYWVYVDALSPKKKTATWTTTCSQALKQSSVYSDCKELLIEALKKDSIPVSESRVNINKIIGGAIRVAAIRKWIIGQIKEEEDGA